MRTASTAPRRRAARGNDGWSFPDLVVETWGDFACFTRPELKAERVSYQVMTPSAAEGLLRAIFWKPQFQYVIRRIEVLEPIRWMLVRRNEVQSVISPQRVKALRAGAAERYDVEEDRDQRSTMGLRDVRYRIHAQIVVDPKARAGSGKYPAASEEKYRDQLRRRVERGACFSQPFFGCREFTAHFGAAEVERRPIAHSEEFGVMLHSIAYTSQGERYQWFRAALDGGVLEVTDPLADDAVAMPHGPWRSDGAEG
ncbi:MULTISPECIES: type I-C CRISPR-associated protein Cas5c [unclassified Streptomyces]|uniref:type I-C CRISPR-associated protein Cas5c n=1 Tax=unclassified Streptomyces TaxID=2593676 RepID=UPI002DD93DE4|nr:MULTISPECIES: type I-C CRISPR-associated protein Cas5c [unclassified Streptomyces]WSS46831.1 type I-C CRISPR-associated protein Cas5c [Streptomyces sp. NBC_01187]WSA97652.1 type I-C CRISPR-associated protein Cas5c [Streptomyces sp. NBC_01795]WSB82098.1 type I-C CRISPR-associated protein Cas5c [Streptomyces sp. NBC_01775]WSS18069.1 type I-C CRISPR-associated protein Cas5c [Streptomyces sp. NBC_01186]WSS46952.1 type I-C CRISPR-associated protein Cas5c [Streptomyces sp. NBC_01187]